MVQYPVDMPTESLMLMLDKVRGKDVESSRLLNAAWNVAGYGLGKWQPIRPDGTYGFAGNMTEEAALESMLASESEPLDGEPAQGIVIGLVIGVVVKLALRLLSEYLK